jgi:ABC-type glycerol-3-phosphate transport system substrate-binding protein
MKKLMMSLMAVALLSTAASAKTTVKTTEKAPKENVNVKTTTYRIPKTNTLVKVTEEIKESKGQLTHCVFVLSFYDYDTAQLVGTHTSDTYTSGGCGSFFRACRAYWGV